MDQAVHCEVEAIIGDCTHQYDALVRIDEAVIGNKLTMITPDGKEAVWKITDVDSVILDVIPPFHAELLQTFKVQRCKLSRLNSAGRQLLHKMIDLRSDMAVKYNKVRVQDEDGEIREWTITELVGQPFTYTSGSYLSTPDELWANEPPYGVYLEEWDGIGVNSYAHGTGGLLQFDTLEEAEAAVRYHQEHNPKGRYSVKTIRNNMPGVGYA